uniref:Uncharacterized protein n=1 Tax=Arundo donax TaxID=35708 RepID=A0A0A9GG10_ARUDO
MLSDANCTQLRLCLFELLGIFEQLVWDI